MCPSRATKVLTRDIISPVKRSVEGLSDLIKEYEKEQMEREIYALLPIEWHEEMRIYTENEFASVITRDRGMEVVSFDEINKNYNSNEFNPRDGELIEAADHLAAFIEAYMSIKNGMISEELEDAKSSLKSRYKHFVKAEIRFGEIYADFE
ncbi:HD domain-containing protein [Dissulfurispira sp.]|uniref:HD domain-containing protein n=1 Tax=Dissulfurispira sp. TaxID=2817609 RepID=UPI002FD9D7BA